MTEPRLRILSLGAGVQSTTLALMAARRDIGPMPDAAIFSDTGWEPKAVYKHLEWLEKQLPFPVYRVSTGNIREDLLARGSGRAGRFVTVPFFLKQTIPAGTRVPVYDYGDDANDGGSIIGYRTTERDEQKKGIGRRQCTSHYKIEPIRKKLRELLGVGPRERIPAGAVEKWIGISLDEIMRATPSKVKFEVNRFPLLEQKMSRRACLQWLETRQYPTPPKSSCIGCPFHSDAMWREIRETDPDAWADAVEVDRAIRKPIDRPGVDPMRGEQFMHASLKPLDEVDLSTAEDRGQLNLFLNECEGMCGV